MNTQLISIAICTFNGEKYLKEQLDSILNQTYKNIEVIAVDDCSSDKTQCILQEYALKYPIIKVYLNQENKGYSKNFEYAISLCKGEYISISDQDDIWELFKLETLLKKIKLNDDLLVYSSSLLVDENGKSLNKTTMDKSSRYCGGDPRALALFNIFLGHTLLLKRELLEIALPIPQNSTYDSWLGFVAINENRVCLVDQTLTHFRQHHTNASKNWEGSTKLEKITLLRNRLQNYLIIPNLQYRAFFEELYRLVDRRANKSMNIKLLIFLFKHREILAIALNTSSISKLNHIRKFYI